MFCSDNYCIEYNIVTKFAIICDTCKQFFGKSVFVHIFYGKGGRPLL